jgi:GGDEF domain-containing protein
MARWGGDEFVMLLPRTGPEEAAQIIARVKREFSREKVQAIKAASHGPGVQGTAPN